MTNEGADVLSNSLRGEVRMILGGEPRLAKVNFNSLAAFSEMHGIGIDDIANISSKKLTLLQLRDLIYCALVEGARIEGKTFTATKLEVGDWLQEAGMEKVAKFMKAAKGATEEPEKRETSRRPTSKK